MMKTIIHVPHASTFIPEMYLSTFDCTKLKHEILAMTDWYCDELFDCREQVVFPVSRLVCDVERFRDDKQEIMASVGMGAVYTAASDLSRLREVSPEEKEEILRKYYDLHHKRFKDAVTERLTERGQCLIIDGHSFPDKPLPYELDKTQPRPDFCIGTSNFHTPYAVTKTLTNLLQSEGFSVSCNTPFEGTIVPMDFYEKDPQVVSVMIEVNRRLYMNEPGVKNESFPNIKRVLTQCIEAVESCLFT